MGSKNKLKKFKENDDLHNVIQPSRESLLKNEFKYKGNWFSFFKNNNPIVLELGCGKGEYSINLAKKFPDKNFIGMDIKGARLWHGAKNAIKYNLSNVVFLRAQIDLIENIFSNKEVDEIWIVFPDPQIKFNRTKHRLINQFYLNIYKKLIKDSGLIHLKTDSEFLHGYTLGLLEKNKTKIHFSHHDIYSNQYSPSEATEIKTHYEKIFLSKNKPISYIKFEFE